ncbi:MULTISPECIES: PilZ domain-containing protein [Deefgea]|uniref:Cyclic di-GMP receptor atypical PilZ domain-containing protein n=1 Tax=Deefgea chitinilytica TaxID=570276 RepID=A0ABS2C8P9_9NEIS|nr:MULTISPECIES: PilZ domain-containing protein [Deefgea]MBM5570526.1 hypothetical protein [Deefgea chitinilytica]MBM9887755.1 PilZ domain-containing protein [Deefgea sp. CFH1-16]
MTLAKIDGPAFFRDTIPFAWQQGVALANDWEMSRYLHVLADFEQVHDYVDDLPHSQNAKTDLMLLWLARSLNQALPTQTSAVFGLEHVIWQSPHRLPIAQEGVVAFCLSAQFPFLLQFPAKIVSCMASEAGFEVTAAWQTMSPILQDSFEKTIFRYHRRHIHQLRERKP